MPLSAVLLVLASTVLHAGWNTRLHRGSDPEVVIALAYLFVGIVLVPAAVLVKLIAAGRAVGTDTGVLYAPSPAALRALHTLPPRLETSSA